MATYRSVNPGIPGSPGDDPDQLRGADRPDETTVIPRIAAHYVPIQPLFPPWVSTAAIMVLFGLCFALSALFTLMIANILIGD